MAHEARILRTADGLELEAELSVPERPRAAAVLCHPHPTYGGSMHTIVPAALFEALPEAGVAALRFNFRGVGRSQGSHDQGRGERLDVVAAIDTLAAEVPGVPVVAAGWSFGADTALAVDDARLAGWVAVAAPLAILPIDQLVAGPDRRPKLLLVPEHDQYRTPEAAAEATADWPATTIVVLPHADHFIGPAIGQVVQEAVRFASTVAN